MTKHAILPSRNEDYGFFRTLLTISDTAVTGFSRQTFDGTPASSDNVIALLSGTYKGMSGGPVLFSGKVVGVIVRGPDDDDRTIPFLAVRSEFVNALLATPQRP